MPRSKPPVTLQRDRWRDAAACRNADPEQFYPLLYDRSAEQRAIDRWCVGCPVKAECLDEAMSIPVMYDYGIWGGMTEMERFKLRQQREGRKLYRRRAS